MRGPQAEALLESGRAQIGSLDQLLCGRCHRRALEEFVVPPGPIGDDCIACERQAAGMPTGWYGEDFGTQGREEQNTEHEAAHAVVNHLLGHRILDIEICDVEREFEGTVILGRVSLEYAELFEFGIGSWAGLAAGLRRARLNGCDSHRVRISHAFASAGDIRWIMENLSPRLAEKARLESFAMVEDNWPAIEALGAHLLRHGSMGGAEASRFIREHVR